MVHVKKGKYKNIIVFIVIFIVFGIITAQDHIKTFINNFDQKSNKTKELVAEVIMENPELIIKSLQEFHLKKEKEHNEKIISALSKQKDDLQKVEIIPTSGHADSDIVIQYFFDYNCGYCKMANKAIKDLKNKDNHIKILYHLNPILGPNSEKLAKIGYAIYLLDKEKFVQFHDKVMESPHVRDEDFNKLLTQINLDPSKVMNMVDDQRVSEYFNKINNMVEELKIMGSPVFIINNDIIRGAIPLKAFEEKIAVIRTEKAKK